MTRMVTERQKEELGVEVDVTPQGAHERRQQANAPLIGSL